MNKATIDKGKVLKQFSAFVGVFLPQGNTKRGSLILLVKNQRRKSRQL
jgi:hypothetical protein